VGRRDWVVVTADKRIKRRLFERETLISAGVRSFVLGSGNLGVQAIIAILTSAMPAMLKLIAEQAPPFIARIKQTAEIELLHPKKTPTATPKETPSK
jgi:PIN like domain